MPMEGMKGFLVYIKDVKNILNFGGLPGFNFNIMMGKEMLVALVAVVILLYLILRTWQETPFTRVDR